MKIRIHYLLVLVLLLGCAPMKPIPPETLNRINRIGIVSILEDKLRMQFTGFTIFNNYIEEIPVHHYKIDEYVVSTFEKEIVSHTDMSFVRVVTDIELLLSVNERRYDKAKMIKQLADLAAKNDLDAIIFVKRAWSDEPILFNVKSSGYGVCKQMGMAAMYLIAEAKIYDARSMALLSDIFLHNNESVDVSFFNKDIDQLTRDQTRNLEQWVKTSIKKDIIEGLRRYGFMPNTDKS